jgi:hypothetical protein
MKKRLFQVLDEMNQNDEKNKTATCGCNFDLVEAKTAKGGGHVTIGVPAEVIHHLWNGTHQPFLIVLDKKVYHQLKDQPAEAIPTPEEIAEWKEKAGKWDDLDGKIGKYYPEEEGEECRGDLCDIGEAAAIAFGYM